MGIFKLSKSNKVYPGIHEEPVTVVSDLRKRTGTGEILVE